jgi:hypothetical protein
MKDLSGCRQTSFMIATDDRALGVAVAALSKRSGVCEVSLHDDCDWRATSSF